VKLIVEKNISIARKTYKADSMHMLYHLQSCLVNKIALGEIITPTEANPMIKEIRAIISKQHDG